MLAHKEGVNEWAGEIELTLSIFLVSMFEASCIMAGIMHLFNHGNCIAIMIDQLKPIGIKLIFTRRLIG